jgi:hypothetical protein
MLHPLSSRLHCPETAVLIRASFEVKETACLQCWTCIQKNPGVICRLGFLENGHRGEEREECQIYGAREAQSGVDALPEIYPRVKLETCEAYGIARDHGEFQPQHHLWGLLPHLSRWAGPVTVS